MEHFIVHAEPGKYCGWPANGGLWRWGDEVLVSYQRGDYRHYDDTHCIDRDAPIAASFARSLDGGVSWTVETPQHAIYQRPATPIPAEGLPVRHPDFVLRVGMPSVAIRHNCLIYSTDRGHTWHGPHRFPEFAHPQSSRTSYEIQDGGVLQAYFSYKVPAAGGEVDRAFVARSYDLGVRWQFVGEMTEDPPRSVMPSVVRLSNGDLVCALRRRTARDNWIEVRTSKDGGTSWTGAVRAAETESGEDHNGNPPALTMLPDGRLVLVYGYRGVRPSMRYSVSNDNGRSFSGPVILRDDALTHDIGYPRACVREDGRVLAVYYYVTEALPQQHIAATVFSVS